MPKIDRFQTARCPTLGCRVRRRSYQFCCPRCWNAIPVELRTAYERERDYCRKNNTNHTQELIAARDACLLYLNKRGIERRTEAAQRADHERHSEHGRDND